ncbi:MAG: hypothetical protein H6Q05_2091, partial [Acidobacteria bacterium]|nr:hypothetical protein [Acidobacteriota bacterium]
LRWNPQTGDYLLRWLHMILGAVAVAGFFAALLDKENARTSAMAKKTFAYGMAAAIVSGVTYLLSLNGSLSALMRAPAAWALAAGILLSLLALHFFFRRHLVRAGSALAASLFLMVLTRHQLRLIRLEGYFDPAAWRIAPQWGPLFLFLLFLAIAAVVLIVMLRLFFRARAA